MVDAHLLRWRCHPPETRAPPRIWDKVMCRVKYLAAKTVAMHAWDGAPWLRRTCMRRDHVLHRCTTSSRSSSHRLGCGALSVTRCSTSASSPFILLLSLLSLSGPPAYALLSSTAPSPKIRLQTPLHTVRQLIRESQGVAPGWLFVILVSIL
jgi:hypothetical protein